jgi:membrane fusion protein (multidrug efflux system)
MSSWQEENVGRDASSDQEQGYGDDGAFNNANSAKLGRRSTDPIVNFTQTSYRQTLSNQHHFDAHQRHSNEQPVGDANDEQEQSGRDDDEKKTSAESADDKQSESGDDDAKADEKDKPKSLKERPGLLIGGAIVLLLLIIGGILYWLHARQYVHTDDAFIDGHIVRIAPQVAGVVREIHADDNQLVKPNQVLAVIDTEQTRAKFQGLEAQAIQAHAAVDQARTQIDVANQQVATARANQEAPRADLQKAEADLKRYRNLQRQEPSAVAGQQIDGALQAVRSAQGKRDAAARQVDQALALLKAARAGVVSSQAAIAAADAQVRAAGVDLTNGKVSAPIAGRIANRTVALGSYVQPGQEMMAIVPLDLWVTANFKETELQLMKVGQPVDIKIDAFPDVEFHGHVDSFQQGAGQAFALLPAENATGNFVKVVQRVPVRIVIDSPSLQSYNIGPGMSATPRVKVR